MTTTESSAKVIPQACVVPYRKRDDQIEFCLITSLKRKRWIFPKGIIEHSDTQEEAALKEALEEAGLRGRIFGEPLGSYEDSKWGALLDVTVLLMQVDHCEDDWQEAGMRQRRWVHPSVALQIVSRPALKRMLKAAIDRFASGEATS